VSELDEVKAGKYELVAVSWDEITSKPGEPLVFTRHRQGDVIDLNVEDARRLVTAGAVVKPGSRQEAQAQVALANLRAALEQLTPEQRELLLAGGEAVETPTAPKKRAAKKAAGKAVEAGAGVATTVQVTEVPAGAPPAGESEPPDDDDEDGAGDGSSDGV
jgi:hypothetical protein